jgi:hypothetical protein
LKHGYAGYIGEGLSVESQVHVLNLAVAYIVLLHWMEVNSIDNPYFFCENGKEFSWREVGEEVGKALHHTGKIDDPVPRSFPPELYGDLFGEDSGTVFGFNSRSRARLRKLGWEAREKGVCESFRQDELPELLAQEGTEFSGFR